MKEITLTLTVRVDDSVQTAQVEQQIGDAINPDGWNWDVSYPVATSERRGLIDQGAADEGGQGE